MSCGIVCRRGSDPALLWLWCRPVAIALIRPLAWGPPDATRAALEKDEKKETKYRLQGQSECDHMPFHHLSSCVTLGMYPNAPEPQLPHLYNRNT